MSKFGWSLLAAACILSAGGARAETVLFSNFANGSSSVGYTLGGANPAASGRASAGGFLTSVNGGASFVSYCVDLYQYISFGTPYADYYTPAPALAFNNASAYTDLSRLYARAGSLGGAVGQAAFQVAVWEIVYEKTGNAYALNSGDARFDASAEVTALASDWLSSLGPNGPAIGVLASRGEQDVIFAPVPEPETYALMLAGLGAIGAWARRRQRR